MKKVKIAHRDMSISKISEKILKISEDYEKAKEEDNKELMEELKKEYEYQKAVLNASENFFAKCDEDEMKEKANYSSDEEEVKRAKWILKNKKEYQDKEDLFDAIIASKSLEEAKDVVEEQKEEEKQGSLVFRKFNKRLAIGITAAALAIGGLIGLNLKKQSDDKQNLVRKEQTAEMDDLTDNFDSTTEQNTEVKEKSKANNVNVKKKSFSNDEIKADESYKKLKYKGNGETIEEYAEKNGIPTSGKPEDTVTTKEINVTLPSKPGDKVKTEILPEKVEPSKEETDDKNNNKTDDSKKDNKNDKEKVTVVDKEEKPGDNDPSKIEDSTEKDNNKTDDSKKDDNKPEEPTTEDNTPKDTEEKPDFKEPTEIEEDDNDITYVDDDKNKSNESTENPTTENPTTEEPTTEEPTTDESTTEDNTPKDTEEKPDFKDPEIIEEDENDISYISSLKNNYIALKSAIMTELANMNQTKSVEDSGPVLTYTSSKNC